MFLDGMRVTSGDHFWRDRDNIGLIPNGDGTFRKGPKMTVVYDSCHKLMKMVLMVDAITAIAWVIVLIWAGNVDFDKYLGAVVMNVSILAAISVFCFYLTSQAVRVERLMVFIANGDIEGKPVMGMHDDWPIFDEVPDVEIVTPVDGTQFDGA